MQILNATKQVFTSRIDKIDQSIAVEKLNTISKINRHAAIQLRPFVVRPDPLFNQFSHTVARNCDRTYGSKAKRSFDVQKALSVAGFTLEQLLLIIVAEQTPLTTVL